MNIDEYRAMKAEMETSQKEEQVDSTAKVEEPNTQETTADLTPEVDVKETDTLDEIEIDGIGKVKIDELKNGYLRQSDYTRKTQQLAETKRQLEKKEQILESIRKNPELGERALQTVPGLNPYLDKLESLEEKLADMELERELTYLTGVYSDFDTTAVLKFAHENKIYDLDEAYKTLKSLNGSHSATSHEVPNVEELTKSIYAKIVKDLGIEPEAKDTSVSIISGKSAKAVESQTPTLTQAELNVAEGLGLTPEEYLHYKTHR